MILTLVIVLNFIIHATRSKNAYMSLYAIFSFYEDLAWRHMLPLINIVNLGWSVSKKEEETKKTQKSKPSPSRLYLALEGAWAPIFEWRHMPHSRVGTEAKPQAANRFILLSCLNLPLIITQNCSPVTCSDSHYGLPAWSNGATCRFPRASLLRLQLLARKGSVQKMQREPSP